MSISCGPNEGFTWLKTFFTQLGAEIHEKCSKWCILKKKKISFKENNELVYNLTGQSSQSGFLVILLWRYKGLHCWSKPSTAQKVQNIPAGGSVTDCVISNCSSITCACWHNSYVGRSRDKNDVCILFVVLWHHHVDYKNKMLRFHWYSLVWSRL